MTTPVREIPTPTHIISHKDGQGQRNQPVYLLQSLNVFCGMSWFFCQKNICVFQWPSIHLKHTPLQNHHEAICNTGRRHTDRHHDSSLQQQLEFLLIWSSNWTDLTYSGHFTFHFLDSHLTYNQKSGKLRSSAMKVRLPYENDYLLLTSMGVRSTVSSLTTSIRFLTYGKQCAATSHKHCTQFSPNNALQAPPTR